MTVAMASHTWADPRPDVAGLVSDALVVLPWGRYALEDGRWRLHPEYVEALALQRTEPKGRTPRVDAGRSR
ncbi:MAG: hypothetical protein IMX02_03790 [Limnochordaceae bacterium]|nr:hypothetical protein [Limnochordaceae bacterium]